MRAFKDGKELWRVKIGEWIWSLAINDSGLVVAGSSDGILRAFQPTSSIRLIKRETSILLRVNLPKQVDITLNGRRLTLPPGSYETELEVSYPADFEVGGRHLSLNSPIPSLSIPSSVKAGSLLTIPVRHRGRLRFSGSALQRPIELTVDGEETVALPITRERGVKELVIEAEEAVGSYNLIVE